MFSDYSAGQPPLANWAPRSVNESRIVPKCSTGGRSARGSPVRHICKFLLIAKPDSWRNRNTVARQPLKFKRGALRGTRQARQIVQSAP